MLLSRSIQALLQLLLMYAYCPLWWCPVQLTLAVCVDCCLLRRFHLMGGECNYLLRVNPATKHLEFVSDEEWMPPEMLAWDEEDIKAG